MIAASKTLFALRMLGFALAFVWLVLLFVSFAESGLHSLVNETGPYVFAIILLSLLVLRPLQSRLERQAKH